MMRILVMLIAMCVLGSCAKSSKPDEFRSSRGYSVFFDQFYYVDVDVSFEDAWTAVTAALEDLGWNIETQIESSGSITTGEKTIGTNRDRYACRQWPGSNTRVDEMTAKLSIHAGSEGGATRVRLLADINGRYIYVTSWGEERVGGWWPCNSTGQLESELFDAMLTRLEPLKYEAPVYRKRISK